MPMRRAPALAFATLLVLTLSLSVSPGGDDASKARFPSGRECAAQMTVPDGFEVKLFAAEPDVVNPVGIDFDHRGRAYVLELLEYPRKAPAGQKGRDRIRIYDDTDGDGAADKVTTFAEGLNLATGIAVGHGGVFVGEAPYLLFLKDVDGDDKADERTVLLDGWGHQDTHETLNSFIWGPDGWLYGCHGVFTHSRVGKPGTPNDQRVPLNAGIWRYHPRTQKFELFSEGTSNPWGYDYDENGSGFLTACVIPHLFHMVPGGLYIRQAGQNFNLYGYGQIPQICDHVHYFGPSSHVGNKDPRRFDVGGGHAHSACLIYQGGAFPDEWNGRVLMNNLHGARINSDVLKRNGSTYVGSHGPDLVVANDPNFRAIQLRTGPDGSVYMIDWYDPQICHNTDPAIWDRRHGRVYKVRYKGAEQPKRGDLSERKSDELVELLKHKNSWWWRQALLILDERGDKSVADKLKDMVRKADNHRHALRALWALNNIEAFDEAFGRELLGHGNGWVRSWAVRLLGQFDAKPADATWGKLVKLAETDASPDVRMQLASSCQRWRKHRDPRDLLQALMRRSEDARDPVIPLLVWVAYEPGVVPEQEKALDWLAANAAGNAVARDHVAPRALRRLLATGESKHLEAAVEFLGRVDDPQALASALGGMLEGLRGRRLEPPPAWREVAGRLRRSSAGEVAERGTLLGVHFGDADAVAALEKVAADPKGDTGRRVQAVQALSLARLHASVKPLTGLAVGDTPVEVKREALRALSGFDDSDIPATLLGQWAKLPADLRKEVVVLLTGRKTWAPALLDAVEKKAVERGDLNENDVRRLLAFKDAGLTRRVESVWGKLREQTPAEVNRQLEALRRKLASAPGDRKAGQAVFEKNCSVCHTLDGKGHAVGPDLTGANRRDPEYLLVNVIDPNRVVGKDYYTAVVEDKAGRIHTGLLAEDTPQRVTLKGENAKLTTLPRADVVEMKVAEKSLMPEGLPNNMTEQQFLDLIAFLMEDPFLARGLIAGPFKMALDFQSPLEKAADPLKADGVKWKPFRLGPTGVIDMEKLGVLAPPTDSTAFIVMEVRAPRATRAALEVAADEGVKVWLDGKEVHRRTHSLDPQRVPLELKEGVNRLMFKVHNIYGPSWLRARISDPERVLEVVEPKAP